MRLIDYWCPECHRMEKDVFYKAAGDVKSEIPCPDCHGLMQRIWNCQIFIDDWSPMTNDAKRDIDHFSKKKIINGKYCDIRGMYREDRMKQNIPMNLQEV